MEILEHIAALRREGELLAAAAERADLDSPIPTCPAWRMRDLVRHMGDVHRWAAAHIADRRLMPIRKVDEVAGPLPADPDLLDWFREGHSRVLDTLESAEPDVQCWTFLPAPSAVAFWARRQAHETGIHRADAESPGESITPFAPGFAVDGVDEILLGFFAGPDDRSPVESRRTLHLHATDADGEWLVRIGAKGFEASRGHADADCTVLGSASDLDLLLWNRRTADGLDVAGDDSLLSFWRETAQIHWSRSR
jgi:uncharacterized protein (TIGR03083 family)